MKFICQWDNVACMVDNMMNVNHTRDMTGLLVVTGAFALAIIFATIVTKGR